MQNLQSQTVPTRQLPQKHPRVVAKRRQQRQQRLRSLIPDPRQFGPAYLVGGIFATVVSLLLAYCPMVIFESGFYYLFMMIGVAGMICSIVFLGNTPNKNRIMGGLLGAFLFIATVFELLAVCLHAYDL